MKIPDSLNRVAIAYPSGNATAVVFDQLMDVDREQLDARLHRASSKLSATTREARCARFP